MTRPPDLSLSMHPFYGIFGVMLGSFVLLPAILIVRPCIGLILRIQYRWKLSGTWMNIGGSVFIAMMLLVLGVSFWLATRWTGARLNLVLTRGFLTGEAAGMIAPLSLVWICACMGFAQSYAEAEESLGRQPGCRAGGSN